jgi:nickel superoxide dismutase
MKIAIAAALTLALAIAMLTVAVMPPAARAHCQVPCGIYDDPARVQQLREDAATIAKAVAAVADLAGKPDPTSANQLVRWVTVKEEHASHVIDVVSVYFLTQRVKPVAEGADGYAAYLAALADHHAVLVAAMKTKQTPTDETVAALKTAIDALATHYVHS